MSLLVRWRSAWRDHTTCGGGRDDCVTTIADGGGGNASIAVFDPIATQPLGALLARTFGSWVRDIRLTKSRPDGSHGYSPNMTQADLGTRLHETLNPQAREHRMFDAAWVRKLECGEIRMDLRLARCVADALGANADETAVHAVTAAPGPPNELKHCLRRWFHHVNLATTAYPKTQSMPGKAAWRIDAFVATLLRRLALPAAPDWQLASPFTIPQKEIAYAAVARREVNTVAPRGKFRDAARMRSKYGAPQ